MTHFNQTLSQKVVIPVGIFLLSFSVFFIAPVLQVADSSYSMMLSQSIIDYGSINLGNYNFERVAPFSKPGIVSNGYPYQIEEQKGKLYYFFPHGTSILSAPFVALLNIFSLSSVNSKGEYDFSGEAIIEKILASFLSSLAVTFFYFTSRQMLGIKASVCIALLGAFATPILSTASRALWAHTWIVVLLSITLFILLNSIINNKQSSGILLATLASWMYFVRPTASISIVFISLIVLIYFRKIFIIYCIAGLAWLVVFIAYSKYHFGKFLPTYYAASRIGSDTFWEALVGNMISPARGLLVYSPFIIMVFCLLWKYRKLISEKKLLLISISAIVTHWAVVSSFPHWWSGHSYGPRFMTDIIPWLIVIMIIASHTAIKKLSLKNEKLPKSVFFYVKNHIILTLFSVMFVLMSLFTHFRGAYSHATSQWNATPTNVDTHSDRLWDWRYPQFLAGLIEQPHLANFPLFKIGDKLFLNSVNAEPYLVSGWSGPESNFRWTDGNVVRFGFRLDQVKPLTFTLRFGPFVSPNLPKQRFRFKVNGHFIAEFLLREQPFTDTRFVLPVSTIKETNIIEMSFPDATSPKKLNQSPDERNLGIAVHSIEISDP